MKFNTKGIFFCFSLTLSLIGSWGCATHSVSRIDPNTQVDLSGNWNDTDSHQVSDEMIGDCMKQPWLARFTKNNSGKTPTVIAGSIRNDSEEHIPTDVFLMDIERALVNSGQAQVAASSEERGEVRQERADQQVNASPETLKKMGQEQGADYMLIGKISQINDQEEGKQLKYYQVDLTLVDIQTNLKVWLGQKKIKKMVNSSQYKP